MTGGEIIGIIERSNHSHVTLNVQGSGCERSDTRTATCKTVRRDTGARATFDLGDQVWWQCGVLYWSPRDSDERDIPIDMLFHS